MIAYESILTTLTIIYRLEYTVNCSSIAVPIGHRIPSGRRHRCLRTAWEMFRTWIAYIMAKVCGNKLRRECSHCYSATRVHREGVPPFTQLFSHAQFKMSWWKPHSEAVLMADMWNVNRSATVITSTKGNLHAAKISEKRSFHSIMEQCGLE